MLKVGDIAPKFILPDQKGSEFSLTEKLRDGALILFFYPADFTPGCTKEVCAIRDIHEEILSVGMQVVGVSPQNRASHSRFSDEYDLPYTLICDPDKVAIKMYDADGPMGFGVRRITYLISQEQRIQAAICADLRINKHEEFIHKAILLREAAGIKKPDHD